MKSLKDGKRYSTDVTDTVGILRIIQATDLIEGIVEEDDE